MIVNYYDGDFRTNRLQVEATLLSACTESVISSSVGGDVMMRCTSLRDMWRFELMTERRGETFWMLA